ncbi:MAG: metalloregulator ArsR/SmtB family transcription factor [Candidatus Methanomethylophilus sp.]|jgi:SAM-dependent methyltransferase/DNA-binding transcriptional ArsR family regulator|nr:metalloregulator ArsR/SmtB family transcription factor [Methanomethylophilus sp.]MCI2093701.1 metalloregulator ArsR/SmtB family transcription factor [Methanomethylophilus sp.]WII09018.1 metalloregulator ArsR/SmtB family transcription factor [Methanomassiliicoccales archaeon LGM-DZ1]
MSDLTKEQVIGRISDAEVQKEVTGFWEDNARGYGLSTRMYLKTSDCLEKMFSRMVGTGRCLKIADMGSGAGYSSITLSAMGHDVTSMDISPKMLEQARWNADYYGADIDFVLGNAENPGLESCSFDAVVANDTLFTICDPGKAVSEWVRLLRPGGFLFIADGNYFFDTTLEEYRQRSDYMRTKYSKEELEIRPDIGNIDYQRLRGICRNLYVNRIRRPSWETWFLMELGIKEIKIESTDSEHFTYLSRLGKMSVPMTYAVCARTPFSCRQNEVLDRHPAFESGMTGAKSAVSALATEDRIRIAALLSASPMSVKEIQEVTGLPQNLVSYDLRIMKEGGIVRAERAGRSSVYSLTDADAVGCMLEAARSLSSRRIT